MAVEMSKKERLWTLPNLLTLSRIILIPFFILSMTAKRAGEALFVFSLAGLTDILDGFAARTWHLRSKVGKILDPAADKMLMTTAYILGSLPGLSFPYAIPLWLTAAVISRDLAIAAGAYLAFRLRGVKDFTPSLLGKACAVLQAATVFLVLLANFIRRTSLAGEAVWAALTAPAVLQVAFILTLAATLLSWMHYGLTGIRLIFRPRTN